MNGYKLDIDVMNASMKLQAEMFGLQRKAEQAERERVAAMSADDRMDYRIEHLTKAVERLARAQECTNAQASGKSGIPVDTVIAMLGRSER